MQFRVMIATVAFVVFALSVDAAFSRKAEPVVSNFVNKFASEIRGAIKLEERYSEIVILPGHDKPENAKLPRPHEYVSDDELPTSYSWDNIKGKSFLTKTLNQHIPQYCGSCWAHGAASALADRIKIARDAKGVDVNLAIQYILNCGTEVAGSCHGGSAAGVYQFVHESGFIPYDTCLQYAACSSDSDEGNCGASDYSCQPMNVCRTCSTFSQNGGFCSAIDVFPNATVAEYGKVSGEKKMMKEIFKRGPIACDVNASPLDKYQGGILDAPNASRGTNHVISVVGWGEDELSGQKYWVVRNSWGEYWGEMGYFRLVRGENQLGLEGNCAWATPAAFTQMNYGCYEDGSNCISTGFYTDPAHEYLAKKDLP